MLLLLRAAWTRSRNRYRHQLLLRRARNGRAGENWSSVGLVFVTAGLVGVHLFVAGSMMAVLQDAERYEVAALPASGAVPALPLPVSAAFLSALQEGETHGGDHRIHSSDLRFLRPSVGIEAARIARERGGDPDRIAEMLQETALTKGSAGFTAAPASPLEPISHRLADLALTIMGGLWLLMLIGTGEDAIFDGQNRRHPMWEWLFSHPVPPAAVFLAESLAPIASNPLIYAAPLLPAVIYGSVYGVLYGLLALLVVGVPVMLAVACASKAFEFAIMLRCSPRSRGAVLAIKNWIGTAAMGLLFIGINTGADAFVRELASTMPSWRSWPVPVLASLLGLREDGRQAMAVGMLTCVSLSVLVILLSLLFTVWSARRGLVGAQAGSSRGVHRRQRGGFRRWPLLRKELLWLARDRGAIVQIVLLPLSLVGFNLFQVGQLAVSASIGWNVLCGGGIVLGTLFLNYLGPRALASDGAALWIALSWPRGLEQMLRVKAALWTALTAVVTLSVFAFAAWRAPGDGWKVALLVPPYLVFAWSMSLKTSTLATVASDAGEPEPVSRGRRWATQLGALSFATGVISGQWQLAVLGLVYSVIAGAALWEGFQARLPFLLDRWSERAPSPPTLTHALVAIGLLTDIAVVVAGMAGYWGGVGALVLAYAATSALVATGMAEFLSNRGVSFVAIRRWGRDGAPSISPLLAGLSAELALGAVLGGLALLYVAALPHAAKLPVNQLRAYAIIAVFIAPFAEEFLFRGLLYRALDRTWGGWQATAGSAALFAVYHPMLSWAPVGALGLLNAWLFRRTGRLEAAIAAHMAYNAWSLPPRCWQLDRGGRSFSRGRKHLVRLRQSHPRFDHSRLSGVPVRQQRRRGSGSCSVRTRRRRPTC